MTNLDSLTFIKRLFSSFSSASVMSLPFSSFIVPFFVWNVHLVTPVFLKRSLIFLILLFSSISLRISPCCCLELCIQLDMSFPFSFYCWKMITVALRKLRELSSAILRHSTLGWCLCQSSAGRHNKYSLDRIVVNGIIVTKDM